MSLSSNFPNLRPSLLLDFANSKQLDPRIAFTRNSTATYYNGETFAKAEENLLTRSQTNWEIGSYGSTSITANATTAPDGTSTAYLLYPPSSVAQCAIYSAVTISELTLATSSIYLKSNNKQWAYVSHGAGGGTTTAAWFDLTNGVTGTVGSQITSSSIQSIGNGWYRCIITSNTTERRMAIGVSDADNSLSITASGTDGIYYWGGQIEKRSSATAYTVTTTQPVTNYIPQLMTAAANVARFDHNPVTGTSLGLLIEEARTNDVQRSQEFDNAYWTKSNSTIQSNIIVAPDGTLTGDKLVEDSSASTTHLVNRLIGVTSGSYTFSVYAKAAERTWIRLTNNTATGTNGSAYFNLSSGTIGSIGGGTASISAVGNGWYRCSVSGTISSSNTVAILLSDGNDGQAYTGNGYSGIYIWGAQLEVGAFATSYIPTAGATATRNADSASMTGTNFSSWFNNSEGTIYSEFSLAPPAGTYPSPWTINNGTINNRLQPYQNNTKTSLGFDVFTNGSVQANIIATVSNLSLFNKHAVVYKLNDFAASANGGAVGTDTSGLIATSYTQLQIGRDSLPNQIGSTVRKFAYYAERLTDAQLQALTSG